MTSTGQQAPQNVSPVFKGATLWQDPLPDDPPGLLLSDKIAFYQDKCSMIQPFDLDALRPASYELHVGNVYYDGVKRELREKEEIVIGPNQLVYIQTKEFFNIPYYIIGRYSLRVTEVYRGVVLDNGLHVDPGYHGHINVPIYNFTNEPKSYPNDAPFLSMEFTKTTPFRPEPPIGELEEKDWVRKGLFSKGKFPLRLMREDPNKLYHDRCIEAYFKPGERNESALIHVKDKLNEFENELNNAQKNAKDFEDHIIAKNRTQWLTFAGLGLTLVGILVAVFLNIFSLINTNQRDSADTKAVAEVGIKHIESRLGAIDTELKSAHYENLEVRIEAMEKFLSALQATLDSVMVFQQNLPLGESRPMNGMEDTMDLQTPKGNN